MRFMARWITIVVLPRNDTRCVTIENLKILYAMWRKQKYALVTAMLYHWMKLAWDENSISITSFVTRIASELGVLANAQVAFLPPRHTQPSHREPFYPETLSAQEPQHRHLCHDL